MQELQQLVKSPLFGVALSLLIIVLGARMSTGWGNLLLVVAWSILIVSFFRAPFTARWDAIPRFLATGLFASVVGLSLYYTLWVPTGRIALGVRATTHDAQYPAGHVIGGLPWSPRYRELRVKLINRSQLDYRRVDVTIKPDAMVAHVVELGGGQRAWISPANEPGISVEKGRLGERLRVPVELIATDAGYRIQCDRLPADSSLELLVALVSYNTGEKDDRNVAMAVDMEDGTSFYYAPKNHTEEVYGQRPSIDSVEVTGTFSAGGSERSVNRTLAVGDPIGDSGIIEKLTPRDSP